MVLGFSFSCAPTTRATTTALNNLLLAFYIPKINTKKHTQTRASNSAAVAAAVAVAVAVATAVSCLRRSLLAALQSIYQAPLLPASQLALGNRQYLCILYYLCDFI